MFRLFRFNIETASFAVSVKPKLTETNRKNMKITAKTRPSAAYFSNLSLKLSVLQYIVLFLDVSRLQQPVLPLGVSVLQQHVLCLNVSLLPQSALFLDVSVLQKSEV
jgi:hypothetical protein